MPSIEFLSADVAKTQYCEVTLTEEKYQAFAYAVKNHYWYQMYIDDLPIWGKYYLQSSYKHSSMYHARSPDISERKTLCYIHITCVIYTYSNESVSII